MSVRILPWLVFTLILIGCSSFGRPKIEIHDIAVRAARFSPPTAADLNFRCICDTQTGETTSQVYVTVYNRGSAPDRLIKVETEAAVAVELRQPAVDESWEGLANAVEAVEIPAWGTAVFEPGNYQMTLIGLKEDLSPGQEITLRLIFEHSGEMEVEAVIIPKE
jgi:copper(I)-binding protein